jgi:hypothetical protein
VFVAACCSSFLEKLARPPPASTRNSSTFRSAACTVETRISDETGSPACSCPCTVVPPQGAAEPMYQQSKRRSAGPQQHVMMLRQTHTTFSDVEANEKLSEIFKEFANAAAGLDLRLGILAHRTDTLQRIFLRLRISLQQAKRPFVGYDGFQKTLLACSFFIQCFKPPSNHGHMWSCPDSEIQALDAEIAAEISLLTTSIIVLLAYVPLLKPPLL